VKYLALALEKQFYYPYIYVGDNKAIEKTQGFSPLKIKDINVGSSEMPRF